MKTVLKARSDGSGGDAVEHECRTCVYRQQCPYGSLSADQRLCFERTVVFVGPTPAGQSIDLRDEPGDAHYVVGRGAVKQLSRDSHGATSVTDFHLRGAVLWFPSGSPATRESLVALTRTRLCRVRSTAFDPAVQRQWARRQRVRLGSAFDFHRYLSTATKAQRAAAFLLRLDDMTNSPTVPLPMSPSEAAQHLRLSEADLKARLSAFARRGWLHLHEDSVELLDQKALQRVVRLPNPA